MRRKLLGPGIICELDVIEPLHPKDSKQGDVQPLSIVIIKPRFDCWSKKENHCAEDAPQAE